MLMITTTKMATEVAEVDVVASVETRTSTIESTTPMRRASQWSRMRRLITLTTLQEDTRMPQEEISVVEEEATRRMVKASSAEAVVAVVADPGLLKNIEM